MTSLVAPLAGRALPAHRHTTGSRRAPVPSRLRVSAVAEVQTAVQPVQRVPARTPAFTTTEPPPARPSGTSFAAPAAEAPSPDEPQTVSLAFVVPQLRLDFGMQVRIVGGGPALGDWSTWSAPEMQWHEGDVWTAVLALPPGDHTFKLVIVGGDGATHWELGDNRRLHVPAACATPELGGALKVMCSWSETESTRLQTSTFGSDRLRASMSAAETALAGLLYEKAKRQQDSRLDAAIAAQKDELERIKAAHRAKEAAAESRLVGLLYEREAKTGVELAGRIMALKARIGKLQEARATLDAIAQESAAAAPALVRPQFWG